MDAPKKGEVWAVYWGEQALYPTEHYEITKVSHANVWFHVKETGRDSRGHMAWWRSFAAKATLVKEAE